MAIIKQGGLPSQHRQTTMGPRENRAPVCINCRLRKQGEIYVRNANGDFVCAECSSPSDKRALTGICGPDCTCEPDE